LLLLKAFIGNQSTCLKILPQQIQTIVDLICVLQESGGAEYLDLLNAIVKVEGLGLTLKRNQAYVMKYVMQDYNKLANIMDEPREAREQILTLQTDVQQMRYFISLIDLLATCAEVPHCSCILMLSVCLSVSVCLSLSVCLSVCLSTVTVTFITMLMTISLLLASQSQGVLIFLPVMDRRLSWLSQTCC